MNRMLEKLIKLFKKRKPSQSFLRRAAFGSLYRMNAHNGNSTIADIHTKIDMMRSLASDSQISTALSYYANDCTIANSSGDIIWATSSDPNVAEVINKWFKVHKINTYVREHILELATIGNLYVPTTIMLAESATKHASTGIALDNNTIPNIEYDIVPSYNIPPEDIVHVWRRGKPEGYIYQPESGEQKMILYPEDSIIHFSLGGLLGKYEFTASNADGTEDIYDIQFAEPLLLAAASPTQTLSLLEDSYVLSSLIKTVRFINVDCGMNTSEDEVAATLQQMKDMIEQQLSLNTDNGDTQSFINPQSPNNLIYLSKVGGQDPVSITDLDMSNTTDADNDLLNYYQDKKLSVLGTPKEQMNFSSNEGLGGAGAVASQRSALYANIIGRIKTAYIEGWRTAINTYFVSKGMSGFVDKFELHMSPIITTQSSIEFERRDSVLNQATTLVSLLKELGIDNNSEYLDALQEILSEALPKTGAATAGWRINTVGGQSDEL